MSIAPDPGSGPDGSSDHGGGSSASGNGLTALETALRRHLGDGGSEDAVRRAITTWCGDVRAGGMPPEKALVAFKRVLERVTGALPEGEAVTPQRRAGLSRLVTLCIEEYYRS